MAAQLSLAPIMAPLEYTVGGIAAEVSVFLFLITCTVVLRFVARRKQKTNFGVDDYLVIPAWVHGKSPVGLGRIADAQF